MTTLKEALDQLAKGHELDNEQKKLIIDKWQKELGIQPCEDAINRKEALEALKQEEPLVWCDGADEIAAYDQWSSDVDTIKNMPPVQPMPKVGHWIFDEILDRNYYCSECKSMGVDYWDYCPYCGCRMVEPQESEE